MNKLKEKYSDFTITYDEDAEQFVAKSNKPELGVMRGKSLKALKTRIDNIGDGEGREKRITQPKQKALAVSQLGYGSDTSYTMAERIVGAFGRIVREWRRDRVYAWVTDARGYGRERVEISEHNRTIYVEDTPEARTIIKEVIAIGEEVRKTKDAAYKKQQGLLKKLSAIKPKVKELPEWEQ